jgi:protein-S-isoprenylcysteine O-methyltransferase Ste14
MTGARWAGWAVAAAGLVVSLLAAGSFVVRRTTLNPAGSPKRLVVGGAHALALAVLYAGAALGLGRLWPLLLLIAPLASINEIVIPFEEARLRQTFGEEYANYCRRVRRWI